ncbi:Lipoprotein LpqB [Streptomyces badius]
MGTDRRPGGQGRAVRTTALLGCAVVVLAGCGSMPVTGDVKAVDASQPGDSQVQVYAVAPRDGAPPSEIVDGFLESMTSDDPAFATTRKYLSTDARRTWQPGLGAGSTDGAGRGSRPQRPPCSMTRQSDGAGPLLLVARALRAFRDRGAWS